MKNELQWIQALRGIAALVVLFFHMTPHWELATTLSVFTPAMKWGFFGVDIFFALSGFVVYRSAKKIIPKSGFKAFITKRLLRIYLGYWPVLALISTFTIFAYQTPLPQTQKIIFSILLLYPNIWDNWLAPAWSLTLEIYFYFWIAIILALLPKFATKAIVGLAIILLSWGIFWLILDAQLVYAGQQPLRYAMTGLGIEFLAGALVAEIYDKPFKPFRNRPWIGILGIVFIIVGIRIGMSSPYFDRVEVMRAATFGLAGLGALLLFLALENSKFTPPKWLTIIGDSSYSLYLLHTFLLDASGRIRFALGLDSGIPLLIFLLALPLWIVLISLLWYRVIELPLMRIAQPFVRQQSQAKRRPV